VQFRNSHFFCTILLICSFWKSKCLIALLEKAIVQAMAQLHNRCFEKSKKVRWAIVRMPNPAQSLRAWAGHLHILKSVIALFKEQKKCDKEICPLVIFLLICSFHSFQKGKKEQLHNGSFGKSICASDCAITLLKRAVCNCGNVQICNCPTLIKTSLNLLSWVKNWHSLHTAADCECIQFSF